MSVPDILSHSVSLKKSRFSRVGPSGSGRNGPWLLKLSNLETMNPVSSEERIDENDKQSQPVDKQVSTCSEVV